jgi:hypothetical protein
MLAGGGTLTATAIAGLDVDLRSRLSSALVALDVPYVQYIQYAYSEVKYRYACMYVCRYVYTKGDVWN